MQYTNEELAAKIQAGQTGYIPILWEQVQAFVQQQAGRWWRAWRRNRPTLEVDESIPVRLFCPCERREDL